MPRAAATDTVAADSTHSLTEQGIIYDHEELSNEEAAAQVGLFYHEPMAVWIHKMEHPPSSPTGMQYADQADAITDFYLSRGYGQVHYPLYRHAARSLDFRYQNDPFPAYGHASGNIPFYQTKTPYTKLAFGSSLHKDYRLQATHTQNVMPRWNVSFSGAFIKRDGVYTRSGVNDRFYDITTNYYSRDARYQLRAGMARHVLEQQENGGVSVDSLVWEQTTRDGVPVNLYKAANLWRNTSLFVHQSYNTVKQHDSLGLPRPRILNTGVVGLDVAFDKRKRNYSDGDLSHFANAFQDTVQTHDSTTSYALSARLFWTNDAYPLARWRNPLTLTTGLCSQVVWVPARALHDPMLTLSPFVEGRVAIGASSLRLQGEVVSGAYRNGDRKLSLTWEMPLWLRARAGVRAATQRVSPAFIYYWFDGNNARWDYDDSHYAKQGDNSVSLYMDVARDSMGGRLLSLSARLSQVDNLIFSTGNPLSPFVQNDQTALLFQATLRASLIWRWLHLDLLEQYQRTNRSSLLHLPLFACKNSLYADFELFHGAMRVQTGVDARYFTAFAADEWNPYYGLFLPQQETRIGNYLWADFFLTAQIKRATLYVRVAHLNAPLTKHPRYFTLPHYPGEDIGVYYGIVWQFYN